MKCEIKFMQKIKNCIELSNTRHIRHHPPQIMSVQEVALYLGVSVRKIRSDSTEGRIPSFKLGGRVLFRLKDINEMIERLMKGVL
jgi:excisionase family DNA binding protein